MNKQIKKKWHDLNDLVFDLNHSGFHVFIKHEHCHFSVGVFRKLVDYFVTP